VTLLAAAYYFELIMKLAPCPLCITQRFFVLLIGITALCAALRNPSNKVEQYLYPSFIILYGALGAFFAGRMVWLQHLPKDQVPACGPSLEYILDAFPIAKALEVLLRGNGNCAEVVWTFLSLSMPTWVLIAFLGYMALALYMFINIKRS
jgi:protein dithiol:quinone oxidoreductase